MINKTSFSLIYDVTHTVELSPFHLKNRILRILSTLGNYRLIKA